MEGKNTWKTVITLGISLVFAVFFMWLALSGLDFDKVRSSLSQVNYFWVLLAAFFAVLAYWFRAVRWNLLLEPMGYRISSSNGFWTIAFGYMMNLTIPRSGEIARATALYGVEKVPVEKSIATVVVERVVDLCFMLLFLGLAFVFHREVLEIFYHRLVNYQPDGGSQGASAVDKFWKGLGVVDLEAFYLGIKITLMILGVLGVMFIIFKFKQKFINIIKGIIEGLFSVFRLKRRFAFILYSAGIWVCYFLTTYLVFFSLSDTSVLGVSDGFLIITAGTLGMMVPTSGGAGSYHIAVKLAMAGIFVAIGREAQRGEEVGLTYALISHTMQTLCTLVLGVISIGVLMKRKE